jgi:hypothetical protein
MSIMLNTEASAPAAPVIHGLWFTSDPKVPASLRGVKVTFIKALPKCRYKVCIAADQPGAGNMYSVYRELTTGVNPHLPA